MQTPIRLLDEGYYYYLKSTWLPLEERDVYQIRRAPVDMISISEAIVMASTYAEDGMEYLKVIQL